MSLPDIIPIFPLPNLVLFPSVEVPLRIFEPRYKEMVSDVSEAHGIIGMMLLKGNWEPEYLAYPDIFEIGCAGRITKLVQLADGRYNLILQGLAEFRIVREIRDRSYRQAEVMWCPVDDQALELDPLISSVLRDLMIDYVGEAAREAWHKIVEQHGLKGRDLINFLSFHLDFNALEKQTLLEAMRDRASCLIDVLTFKLEERKSGGSGGGKQGMIQ